MWNIHIFIHLRIAARLSPPMKANRKDFVSSLWSSNLSKEQTHTQWLSLLTSVQMRTEKSVTVRSADNDPLAVIVWQRLLPAAILLTPFLQCPSLYQEEEAHSSSHLSCSCFSRGRQWGRETAGRVWMSPTHHLLRLTTFGCIHLCPPNGSNYGQPLNRDLWRYQPAQTPGGNKYTGGGPCAH